MPLFPEPARASRRRWPWRSSHARRARAPSSRSTPRATGSDLSHTAVGYATHHAATLFCAVLFERWIGRRRPAALPVLQDALLMTAIAAAVDYTATPKRFTPGWEFVLSKRSMAAAYGAMAAGLAAGALIGRR